MKIVDRKTVIHNMGDTRTVQHFNTLLGDKPHKLGLVATMYPDLSITVLTDASHLHYRWCQIIYSFMLSVFEINRRSPAIILILRHTIRISVSLYVNF